MKTDTRKSFALLGLMAGLVALMAVTLGRRNVPLGVPREWTWDRLPSHLAPGVAEWSIGICCVVLYASVVVFLCRNEPRSRWSESLRLALLAATAIIVQLLIQAVAPEGHGLSKWPFALHSTGSNGYFTVARLPLMADPQRFWREYPEWIRHQDALHIGTHPPGLFLIWRSVLGGLRSQPRLAQGIVDNSPAAVRMAMRVVLRSDPLPAGDQAALVVVGTVTLILCALTVIPAHLLGRASGLSPSGALFGAACWPLIPSAVLFQPSADTIYPFLAALALALVAFRKNWSRCLGGVVLALGMQLTLAFLGVGLVAGLAIALDSQTRPRERILGFLQIGIGFLVATAVLWMISGANPFVIWWWNQQKHSQFYALFKRSYWQWMLVNPVELAVAMGIPLAVLALIGLRDRRRARLAWATLVVLMILQVSGRNLSEVARLWLPFMPALLPAVSVGADQFGRQHAARGAVLVLLGIQTLLLQAAIQVVYAVTI